jgi:nitroreductase
MDVIEAIEQRKSIRAFKPDPVPREILTRILQVALRAPSTDNTQPWEFAAVTGKPLDELKQALSQSMGMPGEFTPDIPFPVLSYRPPYLDRSKRQGRKVFEAMGIARDDWPKRMEWYNYMARFMDAPVGLIVYVERYLGAYAILDTGLFLENLMLAALTHGLGTCTQMAPVLHPEILRQKLNIPESKLIICAVAIGYPQEDAPVNQVHSEREPLETFATWYGFDG